MRMVSPFSFACSIMFKVPMFFSPSFGKAIKASATAAISAFRRGPAERP